MNANWDSMDAQAEREGRALRQSFKTSAVAFKATRGGVFRTTRGAGNGAAMKPASGGFAPKMPEVPNEA